MKGKRQGIEINDFSGGQVTNAKLIGTDPKYSPDCQNVYADPALRKRFGFAKLNSASVGTNPNGNGIFNWVISATQQYIIAFFGSTVSQMSSSGSAWSGTFTTFGKSTAGTAISDGIISSVVYSGNFIFTTENRDKPQVITTVATSYSNVETAGVGTAPSCKYLQVWKTHLWCLNVGGGGTLTEEASSIGGWTDNDVGTGASTQTTFQGLSTFRLFAGGTSGDVARITKVLTGLTTAYNVQVKTYFDALNTVASGDYAFMDIANGTTRFRTRWSTDGLEIYDGAAWLKVGVNIVTTGVWAVWKFLVTAGTASASFCDVYKDNIAVGLQYLAANASTASSGQIDLQAAAGASSTRMDYHIDYVYINAIAPRSYYYTDYGLESWVSASQASYTDTVLPTTPQFQFRFNESASNSTVADAGSGATNGLVYSSASLINTSVVSVPGKIVNAFSLTSASSHHVKCDAFASTYTTNTRGSLSIWFKPNSIDGYLFTAASSGNNSEMALRLSSNYLLFLVQNSAGIAQVDASFGTLTTGSWYNVILVQNGTINAYVNGSSAVINYITSTNKAAWFNDTGAVNLARVGCDVGTDGVDRRFFDGTIDDLRYYTKALDAAEIASIYAEGNGNEGQPTTVREGTTIYQGTFSYRVNNNGQYAVINQSMTSGTALNGISSIMGAWCNVTTTGTYKLRIDDGTSVYDSATLTGNSTWQYQTLSFTPVSNATTIKAQMILTSSAAATAIFDMVSVTSSGVIASTSQDFSDRLQRTAVATYNDFTGTDSGSNDITTAGDVGLTGSGILRDKLYVFKRWSIHSVTYTGSTPLLDIRQVKSTVGTNSPRSIQNVDIPGSIEVLIFLGTDRRLYMFDGSEATAISDNISITNGISSVYFKNINSQTLDKVYAIYHSDLGQYEIFLPLGDGTQPNYSIIVDLLKQPFAFWPQSNRNFSAGGVSDNGAGQRVIYVQGNTTGYAYLLDTGTNDDGSAINSYWTSFKQGSPVILNRIDEIEVQTDAVACTPTISWRMDWESSYVTKRLSSNIYTSNFNPNRLDNIVQFKFADNSTTASFKLWSIGAYERGLGGGK